MGFFSTSVSDRNVRPLSSTFRGQVFVELVSVLVLLLNLCFRVRFLLRWDAFKHSTVFILRAVWPQGFLIILLILGVFWGEKNFIKLSLNLCIFELSLQKWILTFLDLMNDSLNNYQWKAQIPLEGLSLFQLNHPTLEDYHSVSCFSVLSHMMSGLVTSHGRLGIVGVGRQLPFFGRLSPSWDILML